MKLVKTKGPFITTAHHAVSRKAGEVFELPDEDYEEVKNMCELVDGDTLVEMFDTKKKPSKAKE